MNRYCCWGKVVRGDGAGAGRLLLERASSHDCCDQDAFVRAVAQLVSKATQPADSSSSESTPSRSKLSLTLSDVRVAELLLAVLALCYEHRVRLESRFTTVVIAIAIVEGIGRQLDPDLDLLREAAPFAFKALADLVLTK